jgi:hypothetical protein
MNGVIKSKGKFILVPDPVDKARISSSQDRETLAQEMNEIEFRSLLVKILLRLEKLEQR